MLTSTTIEALRFLALSEAERQHFLPADVNNLCYATEDGAETIFAGEAVARVAYKAIDEDMLDAPEEIRPLLREMRCVLEMMFDLAERIDYFWFLDIEKRTVVGPYDESWLVLKRLASLALEQGGYITSPPSVPFSELLRLRGFQERRVTHSTGLESG